MAAMRKSRKKKEAKTEGGQKQKGNALDKMHKMRRMALMLGNVLPFGVTRDMKNVFLLIDYWQQATQEDIFSVFLSAFAAVWEAEVSAEGEALYRWSTGFT